MSNLLTSTRDRLGAALARGLSLAAIARGAGSPVEYDWLKRFAGDSIPDPSVNRVQALHDYLCTLPKGGRSERRAAQA
jgi:hypothetical protein